MPRSICTVALCGRSEIARGYCPGHYQRWRKYGTAGATPICDNHRYTLIQRWAAKVRLPDTSEGCWIWTAARQKGGYGSIGSGLGSTILAHRYAYQLFVGDVPDGMELDHLCRNTACVNPNHLEAVPHRVNMLRSEAPPGHHARKTHCKNGHPFDEANTYRRGVGRACRACVLAAQKAYQSRKRAAH